MNAQYDTATFDAALASPLEIALSFRSVDLAADHFKTLFASSETKSQIPLLNVQSGCNLLGMSGRLVRFDGMIQDTTSGSLVYPMEWKTRGSSAPSEIMYFCDDYAQRVLDKEAEIVKYGQIFPVALVSVPGTHITKPAVHEVNMNRWRSGEGCELRRDPERGAGPVHQQVLAHFYNQNAANEFRLCDRISVFGILSVDDASGAVGGCRPPTVFVIWHELESQASEICDAMAPIARKSCFQWCRARAQLVALLGKYLGGDRLAATYLLLHLLSDRFEGRNSTLVISRSLLSPSAELIDLVRRVFAPTVVIPMTVEVLNGDSFAPRSTSSASPSSNLASSNSSIEESSNKPTNSGVLCGGDDGGDEKIDESSDIEMEDGQEKSSKKDARALLDDEFEIECPDFLSAGRLQLAQQSVCVVDEGGMSEGKIEERGVRNINTLSRVLYEQLLPCEFPYSVVNVPLKLRAFFVTKSKRSLFADDDYAVVPLAPAHSESNSLIDLILSIDTETVLKNSCDEPISEEMYDSWRDYVEWVKEAGSNFQISEAASKLIEQSFIEEKKYFTEKDAAETDEKNMINYRAEHLDQLLTLTRNLARTGCETELLPVTWSNARKLERIRITRLCDW